MGTKVWLALLTVCYPFLVYFGSSTIGAEYLLGFVALMLVLRAAQGRNKSTIAMALFIAGAMAISVIYWGSHIGVKLYPVLVNACLLCAFAGSLLTKQSAVERLARIKEPNLPESGVRYTRKVTIAWSIFFAVNGSIALLTTLWGSDKLWTLYNGFIAYLLIGLFAAAEWLIRLRVRKKDSSL